MELQRKVKKKFLRYKKIIIEQVGNKGLYDDQITKICKGLFKSKYEGTYPVDEIPIKKYQSTHYFVINTSKSTEEGVHWCSLVLHGSNAYIYDSFGRHSKNILPSLVNILNKRQIHYHDSNHDAEQFGNSEICGQLSIAFLCCFDQFGRDALLI